ncbi:MAG: hypothetical protein EBU49_15810 [Proteobacteria bacterium]|nr:hypothetical protein [Pseudomonadota bacterium]
MKKNALRMPLKKSWTNCVPSADPHPPDKVKHHRIEGIRALRVGLLRDFGGGLELALEPSVAVADFALQSLLLIPTIVGRGIWLNER